jgi:hypothetical protein
MRIKVAPGEIIKFESMPTWKEEYVKDFFNGGNPTMTYLKVKEFIQSLLDKQRKELLVKIRLEKDSYIPSMVDAEYDGAANDGYNQAVTDLEELKKNL